MTRKETLVRLRDILLRRREALRRTLHGELERFNTTDERVVGDLVDQAVDTDYGFINSKLAETESRELEQISHALERFKERTYGVCETCERSIPIERLRALPYATTCIRCKQETERASQNREASTARLPTVGGAGMNSFGAVAPA